MTGDGSTLARIEDLLMECIAAVAVDGGGMSLLSATGMRQPLFGSDDTAAAMERLQFTLGDGPCVDASESGSPVLVSDLDDPGGTCGRCSSPRPRTRTSARCSRSRFASALALGAIDLYRRSPGPLAREHLATTLSTVDAIAGALLDADGTLDAGLDRDRLSSMTVHRAAGMIMEQLGTSIEEALTRLRATAYAEDMPIQKLANDVITRDRRFQEDRT